MPLLCLTTCRGSVWGGGGIFQATPTNNPPPKPLFYPQNGHQWQIPLIKKKKKPKTRNFPKSSPNFPSPPPPLCQQLHSIGVFFFTAGHLGPFCVIGYFRPGKGRFGSLWGNLLLFFGRIFFFEGGANLGAGGGRLYAGHSQLQGVPPTFASSLGMSEGHRTPQKLGWQRGRRRSRTLGSHFRGEGPGWGGGGVRGGTGGVCGCWGWGFPVDEAVSKRH